MDPTQRMVDDSPPPDSPGDDFEDANASVLYARLTVVPTQGDNGQQQEVETGGQTQFDVYGGENRIGRDPDECNIVIHNKTLSRVHAILEIDDVTSMTIHDNHSLNKTFRNGLQLKPDVHYALEGGETIMLGEVCLKFEVIKEENNATEDAQKEEDADKTVTAEEEAPTEESKTDAEDPQPETKAEETSILSNNEGGDDSKAAILVPETPVAFKEKSKANNDEDGKDEGKQTLVLDSPDVSGSDTPVRPENRTLDSSCDGSFLAPSQVAPQTSRLMASSVTNETPTDAKEVPNKDIFDMETQQVDEDEDPYEMPTQEIAAEQPKSVPEESSKKTDIFAEETQVLSLDVANTSANTADTPKKDADAVDLPPEEKNKSIFQEKTQALSTESQGFQALSGDDDQPATAAPVIDGKSDGLAKDDEENAKEQENAEVKSKVQDDSRVGDADDDIFSAATQMTEQADDDNESNSSEDLLAGPPDQDVDISLSSPLNSSTVSSPIKDADQTKESEVQKEKRTSSDKEVEKSLIDHNESSTVKVEKSAIIKDDTPQAGAEKVKPNDEKALFDQEEIFDDDAPTQLIVEEDNNEPDDSADKTAPEVPEVVEESDDEVVESSQASTDKTNVNIITMEMTKVATSSEPLTASDITKDDVDARDESKAEEEKVNPESNDGITEEKADDHAPNSDAAKSVEDDVEQTKTEDKDAGSFFNYKKKILQRTQMNQSSEESVESDRAEDKPKPEDVAKQQQQQQPSGSEDGSSSDLAESEPLDLPSTQVIAEEINQANVKPREEEYEEDNVDLSALHDANGADRSLAADDAHDLLSSEDEAKLVIDEDTKRPSKKSSSSKLTKSSTAKMVVATTLNRAAPKEVKAVAEENAPTDVRRSSRQTKRSSRLTNDYVRSDELIIPSTERSPYTKKGASGIGSSGGSTNTTPKKSNPATPAKASPPVVTPNKTAPSGVVTLSKASPAVSVTSSKKTSQAAIVTPSKKTSAAAVTPSKKSFPANAVTPRKTSPVGRLSPVKASTSATVTPIKSLPPNITPKSSPVLSLLPTVPLPPEEVMSNSRQIKKPPIDISAISSPVEKPPSTISTPISLLDGISNIAELSQVASKSAVVKKSRASKGATKRKQVQATSKGLSNGKPTESKETHVALSPGPSKTTRPNRKSKLTEDVRKQTISSASSTPKPVAVESYLEIEAATVGLNDKQPTEDSCKEIKDKTLEKIDTALDLKTKTAGKRPSRTREVPVSDGAEKKPGRANRSSVRQKASQPKTAPESDKKEQAREKDPMTTLPEQKSTTRNATTSAQEKKTTPKAAKKSSSVKQSPKRSSRTIAKVDETQEPLAATMSSNSPQTPKPSSPAKSTSRKSRASSRKKLEEPVVEEVGAGLAAITTQEEKALPKPRTSKRKATAATPTKVEEKPEAPPAKKPRPTRGTNAPVALPSVNTPDKFKKSDDDNTTEKNTQPVRAKGQSPKTTSTTSRQRSLTKQAARSPQKAKTTTREVAPKQTKPKSKKTANNPETSSPEGPQQRRSSRRARVATATVSEVKDYSNEVTEKQDAEVDDTNFKTSTKSKKGKNASQPKAKPSSPSVAVPSKKASTKRNSKEQTKEEGNEVAKSSSPRARRSARQSEPKEELSNTTELKQEEVTTPKRKGTSRQKATTKTIPVKKQKEEDVSPAPPPPRKSRKGEMQPPTALPTTNKAQIKVEPPAPLPARQMRKRGAQTQPEAAVATPTKKAKKQPSPVKKEKATPPARPPPRAERRSRTTQSKKVSVSSRSSDASDSSRSSSRAKRPKPYVMFTGYDNAQDKRTVTELGGVLTDTLKQCSVLVTDKVRRTAKFMCMAAKGVPIVGPEWIANSKQSNSFQDPWNYIVVDDESEKKWRFCLRTTLENSGKAPLLADYKVYATESVKPPHSELKDIVEFAGGVWQGLWKHTTKISANDLVLTCKEDSKVTSSPVKKGKKRGGAAQDAKRLPESAFDVELLLTGLLQKKLDFKAHALPQKKA